MDDHRVAVLDRLCHAVSTAHPNRPLTDADRAALTSVLVAPNRVRGCLEAHLDGEPGRVRVTGTLDRRLLILERPEGGWIAADLSGRDHASRYWPRWTDGQLQLHTKDTWLSDADLTPTAVERLTRPAVHLMALYHPEFFPLPRFPLGISDVARAARSTLMGTVTLADMQLDATLQDLIQQIITGRPDIIGVSATFGQHDLMLQLLDAAFGLPEPPMVVAGGSLTARNEQLLLQRYPNLLVARGSGEATIEALVAHWHGDIPREEIPGIGYTGAARGGGLAIGRRRRTAKPVARDTSSDILPELDLLPATFAHHGVAQLETSRGCTNACSFCPRGHKGLWAGTPPEQLPWILEEIHQVFSQHPDTSRTLYLVDEEIIGGGPDAVERIMSLAGSLHEAGFAWESSCRIDQTVRTDRDEDWHVERALMWRTLVDRGLRRMLFGVESGVDSILTRFNKETTAEQNALAIRTLSALDVPTRFTYITFDPLMSFDELKATYAFQGRTDLLLRPRHGTDVSEVVRGVRDEAWVAAQATGRQLHTGISYMLVSMECLVGAAYTRQAAAAGLTGQVEPLMGRVACRYRDWRIGVASSWAQRWVDRNFALDYTFKSLEKVLDGTSRHAVRQARVVLKDAAYQVLGDMIGVIEQYDLGQPGQEAALSVRIQAALEERAALLRQQMAATVAEVGRRLSREHTATLAREHGRWATATAWDLINAGESCAE